MLKTWSQIWKETKGDDSTGPFEKKKGSFPSSTKKRSQKELFDFLDLRRKWAQVVGSKLVQVTAPMKIRQGQLYIATSHSAYSQQLSFFSSDVIAKIKRIFPTLQGQIRGIRFVVSPQALEQAKMQTKTNDSPKNSPQKIHQHDPRFIAAKQRAVKMFEWVEDPELQELLISIQIQNELQK